MATELTFKLSESESASINFYKKIATILKSPTNPSHVILSIDGTIDSKKCFLVGKIESSGN